MKTLLIILLAANWFTNARNARGEVCCWESDGTAYYGQYKLNPDGSALLGKSEHVDRDFVVTANPTGHPIVWRYPDGKVKCFSPGTLT